MSNGMKVIGVMAVLLVLGALYTGVYGAGWMGIGHHGNVHHGNSSYMDNDAACDERNEECAMEEDFTLMSCCDEDSYDHKGIDSETATCEAFNDTSQGLGDCHSDDLHEGVDESNTSCYLHI